MPSSFPFREQHATVIRVADFAAMRDWYRDVLGLRLVREEPGWRVAVFDLPGPSYICLYGLPEPRHYEREDAPKCLINWRTEDIVATHAELGRRGIECSEIQDYGNLKLFNFHDPEGTYFDCIEYGQDWLPEKR